MDAPPLSQEQLNDVYQWIDQLPLSRPKKNITRDFSDGVLLAEVISHYLPKMVDIEDYIQSNSSNQKLSNWNTLNKKVLKKINYQISKSDIEHIITNTPDIIERVLKVTQLKIKNFIQKMKTIVVVEKKEVSREVLFKKISQNLQLKAIIAQKDSVIDELKSAVGLFQTKISKMEELIKVKDSKIQILVAKLQQAGVM